MSRNTLTNETWSRLLPILKQLGIYRKKNLRKTVEGILFRLRTGCQWADIPSYFGKANSLYQSFNRWSKRGIFTRLFKHLADTPDMEWVFMDGSHIRVHQHGMGKQSITHQAVGKSIGGHTSKIHLAVDACGNPIEFIITAGNVNDIVVAPDLLAQLDLSDNETVCADRGFDSDTFRRLIQSKQSKANIPYKKNREHLNVGTDWYLYKIRHLVENAFARLKHFRALATRYDKLKRNYESTVSLACALIWLKL